MTARLPLILTLAAIAVLGSASAAHAATAYPSISEVAPMKVGVGDTLTIRGKNFIAGQNRNTVVFRRTGKRAIFVKAIEATKRKLTVIVPEKLKPWMSKTSTGLTAPTRFRLRVLAKRFQKGYTSLKLSPLVAPKSIVAPTGGTTGQGSPAPGQPEAQNQPPVPPDCDSDGVLNGADADDDNDLLSDVTETTIGTDTCKADSDEDQIDDAWEYKSAVDLNQRSCAATEYPTPCAAALPYPGKRPYPNPLDPTDADKDFDGDWMTNLEEYRATKRHGVLDLANLWYSGGLKASRDTDPADGCKGVAAPLPFDGIGTRPEFFHEGAYPDVTGPQYAAYSLDNGGFAAGDGCLNDGERDEDGDFLNNMTEAHRGLRDADWWKAVYNEPLYMIEFAGTDWLDADSDGDGTVDGLDDQDHDDFLNVEEQTVMRYRHSADKDGNDTTFRDGLWVDAFNPCLPAINSRTCPSLVPVEGDVYRPFLKPADTDPIKPRWPLYEDPHVWELWTGLASAAQTLPPPHPLPRPGVPLRGSDAG